MFLLKRRCSRKATFFFFTYLKFLQLYIIYMNTKIKQTKKKRKDSQECILGRWW
nr:MAG TPA: hypothetical protein [Caudoviricetes sp.]